MPGYTDATSSLTLTDRILKASSTGWHEPTGSFVFFDDFHMEVGALPTSTWDSVDCVGAGTAFQGISGTTAGSGGGYVRGITNNVSGNCIAMFGPLICNPQHGLTEIDKTVFETHIKWSDSTTMGMCMGLTDARTEAAIPIELNGTTYTTVPTDGVFWVYDSNSTDDAWHGLGVVNNVDTSAVTGSAPGGAAGGTVLRIECTLATASFFENGTQAGATISMTHTGVFLCPFVAVFTRAASGRSVDVDYIMVAGPRY